MWVCLEAAKDLYVEGRLAAPGDVAECIRVGWGLGSGNRETRKGWFPTPPSVALGAQANDYSFCALLSSSVYFIHLTHISWAPCLCQALQVALVVKNLPADAGDAGDIRSLGWEDPLEEGIATHSNILAWRIPWTEEPSGLQSIGSQRVRHDGSNLARNVNTKC